MPNSPMNRMLRGRGGRAGAPRVLYLAYYFPPSRASGVFRARATANHLASRGWETTVFAAPREFFEEYLRGACDPSLEATVHPRVRVHRPPMSFSHWERDVRGYGVLRRNFPALSRELHRVLQSRVFPELYLNWIPRVLADAVACHLRRPFDLVLATGNPFVSFAAAWFLGRLLGVPYAVDYRDAWTFNQFTEEPKFPAGSPAHGWERRVLDGAAEAVFVNDGMRQWHRERYPSAAERMTVVPNGWEPELLGDQPFRPPDPDRPLRFGYLGTVTSYLPLRELFEGWRLARGHPLLEGAELSIHGHLGFFPKDVAALRRRLPVGGETGVRYAGPFDKADVRSVYAQHDALVFCVPGARYVTSGKVFEYMASGKPVVSVHQPEIAAAEVLSGYPLWFAGGELTAEEVARSFVAAAEAARAGDRERHARAVAHARAFTREATLGPWERRLRKLAGHPPDDDPEAPAGQSEREAEATR
ncbi:glycosyltransferase [Streptomyces xiaopingdaonensis]|uniref:glycosyltransferase n=1 Tax=Streptomyces xiaopingdaonensis TaxID=1565415 RepID=UPI0003031526|nr:glycosyltransferase [Streptomyces xiaopingdaonensis]